jgi:hypothetical protein
MDRDIKLAAPDDAFDVEEISAPTAADAAVHHLDGELLKRPAEPLPSGIAFPSPAPDLAALVRYLAHLKNVPLTPERAEGAVKWVAGSLRDFHANPVPRDPRFANAETEIANRILDILAASDVMHHVAALIEGEVSPDPSALIRRAETCVNQFTGNMAFFRWPEPRETFNRHYADVSWAPITITAPDGSVATSYMRNGVLHRDPAEGPAFHRKGLHGEVTEYWVDGKRHRPHEQGPAILNTDFEGGNIVQMEYFEDDQLHRPSEEGPAFSQTCDDRVILELYREHGALHRDAAAGPAFHLRNEHGEICQYALGGKLHRDHRDGPALIDTNFEGRGVRREEYCHEGTWHRPSAEGPAVIETDTSGRRVLEIYIEHGLRNRDPKEGPAWRCIADGRESLEYNVDDQLHREDGPAVIICDAQSGAVLTEAWYRRGTAHRECGPAVVTRTPDGYRTESWYCEGELHRDPTDGPAHIFYSPELDETRAEYYCRALLHRDDGPARILRNTQSGTVTEEYWINNEKHRDPSLGPALLVRDGEGRILRQEFWHHETFLEERRHEAAPNRRTRRAMKSGKRTASARRDRPRS